MSSTQTETLMALYAQIEEIRRHFSEIRHEAAGIVETSQMPDAALHLNDVLQATEEAATTILDAATMIGSLIDVKAVPAALKQQVNDEIGRIYEASSFQDISGQRIKKVLTHLNMLEGQLHRLSETVKGQAPAPKSSDGLLNGPALSAEAPDQAAIDNLFKQA